MWWLKTAVSKAVEVGNKNNITRVVKNYADSVVLHAGLAVSEGAMLLQHTIGNWNQRSFKHAVKRLEEAAISYNGLEREQLLRRWLILLKETEKLSGDSTEDGGRIPGNLNSDDQDDTTTPPLVLFYDSDDQSEPLNFRDVFLYSQALEGITLSMVMNAPTEEEVSLLLEIFRFCLSGGKEIHLAIISSIQDLAQVFSSYHDEVLVRRDELLQFVQGAISGMKINADLLSAVVSKIRGKQSEIRVEQSNIRVDNQTSSLKKRLDELRTSSMASSKEPENSAMDPTIATLEALNEALAQVTICSKLEGLLLKKKMLHIGDTPESHSHKIEKLKILSESLANSSAKAEKRLSETRSQTEDALKFRGSKESEVGEVEKEIGAEIAGLEKQRDALEAELKRVNISLAAAHKRFQIAKEEKDQFHEANNQILQHLKSKEEELSKSIDSCKVEADVIKSWMTFLEYTWNLQCTYTLEKEKQAKDELEKHEDFFIDMATKLLTGYKKELKPSIGRIKKYADNLKSLINGSEVSSPGGSKDLSISSPRRDLEEEYLDYETKIGTTFKVVDSMKEHICPQSETIPRKEDSKLKELFEDIDKLKKEFESIERPNIEIDSSNGEHETQTNETSSSVIAIENPRAEKEEKVQPPRTTKEGGHNDEVELAKLEFELGKSESSKIDDDYTSDEIGGWEFDELEKELGLNDTEKR